MLYNGKLYGYYDLFKGPKGTLRFGGEADYDYRGTWSGTGGISTSTDPRCFFLCTRSASSRRTKSCLSPPEGIRCETLRSPKRGFFILY
jgi:hypothetical protein